MGDLKHAMSAENAALPDLATTAQDYGGSYYNAAHVGGYDDYDWHSAEWRAFFTSVAERLVALLDPKTSLDVGCAKGMLVQALAARGVDAKGIDISDHAVTSAHEDVRNRLSVRSAVEPIDGRFDMVTCIEVLEHMSLDDSQKAIDNMCASTDRILFSSSPADFHEPTHINTHPTSQWAAWFAERGFYRRTDADVTFLATWAVLFERSDLTHRSIVERYESQFAPMNLELIEKRKALLDLRRTLTSMEQPARVVDIDDEALLARHADLAARDNVIGLEATVARLEEDLRNSRARVRRLRDRVEETKREVDALHASRTWKIGRIFTRPLGRLKG